MTMHHRVEASQGTVTSILVVDDMEANRAMLCRRLEKDGMAVQAAESGPEALSLLAQSLPDMVLLDFMMPGMNGIEVLRELRRNPATRELAVIMVTARAEGDAVKEALEAGADDYVTKPIDFAVLRARIEAQLEKRRSAIHLMRANAVLDERVTLRSMALADLEEELQQEISRRKQLEAELGCTKTRPAEPMSSAGEMRQILDTMERRLSGLFAAAAAGKVANLAQLAELKGLLSQAFMLIDGKD